MQQLFWDTGFGVQANWSIPSGGAPWNSLDIGNQFALTGLSRSYNVVRILREVGLPDPRGLQPSRRVPGRDWPRSEQANEPVYTAAYGQFDMSASYDFTKHFSVFFDAHQPDVQDHRTPVRSLHRAVLSRHRKDFARYQVGFRVAL